jgi:hypothetical protein
MLELIFPFFSFSCILVCCLLVSSPTHNQEGTRVHGNVQWDLQDATNSQFYSFHWALNIQLWTFNFRLRIKSFKCLVFTSFVVARFKKICEQFITCFYLWSCVSVLLNNLLMDLFWCPIMNIMSVHDIHSNGKFPTVVRHDNSNIGNVQVACHR